MVFFAEREKKILKFIYKRKRSSITKTILKKNKKVRGLAFLDFKTYYNTKGIKMV